MINELKIINVKKFKTYTFFFTMNTLYEEKQNSKKLLLSYFLEEVYNHYRNYISYDSFLYYSQLETSLFNINNRHNITLRLTIPDSRFTKESVDDITFTLINILLNRYKKIDKELLYSYYIKSRNKTIKKIHDIEKEFIFKILNSYDYRNSVEVIKKLTFENFIDYVNLYIENCHTKLYIVGNIKNEELQFFYNKEELPKSKKSYAIYNNKFNHSSIKLITEKKDDENKTIILVYQTNSQNIKDLESNILINIMLFKHKNSKIFSLLSELEQYCYILDSKLDYETGKLYIYSLTNNENDIFLIKNIMNILNNFGLNDIEKSIIAAKKDRITQLNLIEDSSLGMIDKYIQHEKNGMIIDLDSHIKFIDSLDSKKIENAFFKWKLAEIYLTGDIKDENKKIKEIL